MHFCWLLRLCVPYYLDQERLYPGQTITSVIKGVLKSKIPWKYLLAEVPINTKQKNEINEEVLMKHFL